MARYIDADALIEKLNKNSIFLKITNAEDKNVIEIINEQPTAYDVDAVVAELEEEGKFYARYSVNTEGIKSIPTYRAIEIVRNGGAE